MRRTLPVALVLVGTITVNVQAQDVSLILATATRAMGSESLTSITYSGTANTGNFGQSRVISGPLQSTAITAYTRTIDFSQPASRAFGPTQPPIVPGQLTPPPGTFNQNITPQQTAWAQQLQIWITPWGFLKGAALYNATLREQRVGNQVYAVLTWSPPQKAPSGQSYRLVGYIGSRNLVDRVETWVEHPVMGDLHIDTTYTDYRDFGGVLVPGRIVQKQADLQSFDATITAATANPANLAELMTPPQPAGGGAAAAAPAVATTAPVEAQRLANGVFRITGNYTALAIDMGDHIVIVEGGQSEARGLAVLDAARKAIPDKPVRYVINSHPHFDHASGLAPFVAEGINILTHASNQRFLERALSTPRTLAGDVLSKANRRPVVEPVPVRRILRGSNNRVLELHQIPNIHSDGMLVAFLPAERVLFSADFNVPAQGQPPAPQVRELAETVLRLGLDFESHVLAHPPNPDRPMTRADLLLLAGTN